MGESTVLRTSGGVKLESLYGVYERAGVIVRSFDLEWIMSYYILVVLVHYCRRTVVSQCCGIPCHGVLSSAFSCDNSGADDAKTRVIRPKSAASYSRIYERTHIVGYGLSLLASNLIQSTATIMSLKWVVDGRVQAGAFCEAQGEPRLFDSEAQLLPEDQNFQVTYIDHYLGSIKQAGNIATAFWLIFVNDEILVLS